MNRWVFVLLLSFVVLAEEDKVPVPAAKTQKDAEKTIKEVFQAAYAKTKPEDRLALARTLLQQAADTKDDWAARYVMLREAADVAAQAGCADVACNAIGELARLFVVDGFALKLSALEAAGRPLGTPESNRTVVDCCLAAIQEAIVADNYEPAAKLINIAEIAAKRSQDKDLLAAVAARDKELPEIQKQYNTVKEAAKTLADKPNDRTAALAVGKFNCFAKGDWARGLPLLAKSNDPALKSLAEMELSNPAESATQIAIADGWWDLSEKESGAVRANLRARAVKWYREAEPKTSGLTQAKVRIRLQRADEGKASAAAKGLAAATELVFVAGNEAQTKGIRVVEYTKDGPFEYFTCGGKPCVKFTQHVYFDLDDGWAEKTTSAEIEIEYVDIKEGAVELQYSSSKDNYKLAADKISFTNTKGWKSGKIRLPDCNFKNALNAGADLRLRSEKYDDKLNPVFISRLVIRRVQ